MPTAHLVHGFNIWDRGKKTTDKLRSYFEEQGFNIKEWDYPWRFLLGTYMFNKYTARYISHAVQEGDIGVGHSNGCAILWEAAKLAPFRGMVWINPALEVDMTPDFSAFVHVYHNLGDKPVWWSKFLPRHPWGRMGRLGYIGPDKRMKNIDTGHTVGMPSISGHSEIFKYLEYWGPEIARTAGGAARWEREY